MDFLNTSAEIDRLLLECDITKEEVSNISLVVPKPYERKEDTPLGRKRVKGVVVQKYVDFSTYKTKEDKMVYVAAHVIKATSLEFILQMKKDKWLTIDYTRPYKDSLGGPIFLIGYMEKDGLSLTKNRIRLAEINGRFPIYALTTTLLSKFKSWSKERAAIVEAASLVNDKNESSIREEEDYYEEGPTEDIDEFLDI